MVKIIVHHISDISKHNKENKSSKFNLSIRLGAGFKLYKKSTKYAISIKILFQLITILSLKKYTDS